MPPPSRYHIVFRHGTGLRILARDVDLLPHRRSLDPYYSQLIYDGVPGLLMMVNTKSGSIACSREVKPRLVQ